MPRVRVIVLSHSDREIRYVLWGDVLPDQFAVYADPSKTSIWAGATAEDNARLQAGEVLERVGTLTGPNGASYPAPIAKTILDLRWAAYQQELHTTSPRFEAGAAW